MDLRESHEEGYEDLLNPNQPQALIILPTREGRFNNISFKQSLPIM